MTYLLDVNALVALLQENHAHHQAAEIWAKQKKLALCPISQLGYLRVAKNAHEMELEFGREVLRKWMEAEKPQWTPADLDALDGIQTDNVKKTTDFYLSNLAQKHGCKLGTFDQGINHPCAELISENPPAQPAA